MLKKKLVNLRRKLYETVGSDRYSHPSLYEMDKKLEQYLPYNNGVFIEAGANDGFSQSNTYYFERFRGWSGVLIEGVPELYQKCVRERPRSRVFNCALVADDYTEPCVTMKYANLMSLVKGALKSESADEAHIKEGQKVQTDINIVPYEIQVPARTLTSILDECQVEEIDLFSLDVEGFELNVLKGLDFNKYRPKYLLIEARFRQEVEDYITDFYVQVDRLSVHDFLYRAKDV